MTLRKLINLVLECLETDVEVCVNGGKLIYKDDRIFKQYYFEFHETEIDWNQFILDIRTLSYNQINILENALSDINKETTRFFNELGAKQ